MYVSKSCTVEQLGSVLRAAKTTGNSVVCVGGPGRGKTQVNTQLLGRICKRVHYINFATKTEEFIGGLHGFSLAEGDRRSYTAPNEFFLDSVKPGDAIIFDEFDKTNFRMQNVALELIDTHCVDGHKVGNGDVTIVCIANEANVRNGSFGVTGLIGNRAMFVRFEPSENEAFDYLISTGLHPVAASYLDKNRGKINPTYDPLKHKNATSRAWHKASNIVRELGADPDMVMLGFSTMIPDEIVAEMEMYTKFFSKIEDPRKVIESPDTAKVPGNDSDERDLRMFQLFAVSSFVGHNAQAKSKASEKMRCALWEYAKRFPAELRASITPVIAAGGWVPSSLIGGEGSEYMQYINKRKELLSGIV